MFEQVRVEVLGAWAEAVAAWEQTPMWEAGKWIVSLGLWTVLGVGVVLWLAVVWLISDRAPRKDGR